MRIQKSKQLQATKRNDDSLTALFNSNKIRDVGCDPFFVHYYSNEPIHLYRNYCRNANRPKLIIDATGSIIKPFKKLSLEKTRSIYLRLT